MVFKHSTCSVTFARVVGIYRNTRSFCIIGVGSGLRVWLHFKHHCIETVEVGTPFLVTYVEAAFFNVCRAKQLRIPYRLFRFLLNRLLRRFIFLEEFPRPMAQQGRSRTFEKEQRALWCRWLHPSKARLLVHGLHANSSRRSVFGYAFFTRVGISSMLLSCRDRPDMVNRFSVLVRFNKALRVRR